MSEVITTTSLKTLFKFPLQGPNWQSRFLIGAALTFANFLVPIVPTIFVSGYVLQLMRRAIKGEELALPEWDNWGRLATDGLRMMLIGLVYLLPGMLVFWGGMIFYLIGAVVLPMLAAGEGHRATVVLPLLVMFNMGIMFLSMMLGSILTLLGAIPLPVATAHFVAQDKVAAAFRLREWWPLLRVNKLGYFISWVIVAGLGAILYFVLMIAYYSLVLCCLIPLLSAPIGFYLSLVGTALFGQTYRESLALLPASEQVTSG